ncbi:MAG TPA: helix-turn-helix domain-containing protein [Pseudolabrys sp.]|nr:helix-turn-helix domain-containing protein [Pseudolabrys sp.]
MQTVASGASTAMVSWSTDTVKARERFSYWRDVVCQSLFNVTAEAPPGHFDGHMSVRSSGPMRFLVSGSSAYKFVRSNRNISRAPTDHYTILMQVGGATSIEQNDASFSVQPQDVAIFDGTQPFTAYNSDGGQRIVAVIPRAMLDYRAPWVSQRKIHRFDSDTRFLDLARRHMTLLASTDLNELESDLLTQNLCNLICLAGAEETALSELTALHPELQLEALLAFCRQNLHHHGLSPQFVADHFGFSVRTLHLRFKSFGQSFGRWLLLTRLEACCRALRNPRQKSRSISEIAYSCGFNDLSHFNKSFRAQFGMTPGEWRHDFQRGQ